MGFRRVRIRWFKIVSVKATSEKIENRWDKQPSIGNTRAECAELMERYKDLEPQFGIEQEYTLMKKGKVGDVATEPFDFNDDGSEPAQQGPYYCSAGTGCAIGRPVADEHYTKCLAA